MTSLNLVKIKVFLERAPKEFKNKEVKIGFLAEDAKAYDDTGALVAEVASHHEYGTSSIPARPFMQPTVKQKQDEWIEIIKSKVPDVVHGTKSADALLDEVGAVAALDIQYTITQIDSPPLSPKTIAARKRKHPNASSFDKPLQDTGNMLASVNHAVGVK